jgi:hypothetical protein
MAQFQRPEGDIRTVLAAGNFAVDDTRGALWFAAT